MSATGKEYTLVHIRDLAGIPVHKLDACLADMRRLILSAHAARAACGDEVTLHLPEVVTWKDDGKQTASTTVRSAGKTLFKTTVTRGSGS